MSDWFDRGVHQLHWDCSVETEVPVEDVKKIYSYLAEVGLIDYDVEKEVVWDLYDGMV